MNSTLEMGPNLAWAMVVVALKGATNPRAYFHGNFLAEIPNVLDAGFRQARRQEGFYLQQRTLAFSMSASGKLVARKAFIFSTEL